MDIRSEIDFAAQGLNQIEISLKFNITFWIKTKSTCFATWIALLTCESKSSAKVLLEFRFPVKNDAEPARWRLKTRSLSHFREGPKLTLGNHYKLWIDRPTYGASPGTALFGVSKHRIRVSKPQVQWNSYKIIDCWLIFNISHLCRPLFYAFGALFNGPSNRCC